MKTWQLVGSAAVLGFAIVLVAVSRQAEQRQQALLDRLQSQWQLERQQWEERIARLEHRRPEQVIITRPPAAAPASVAETPAVTPESILEQLQRLRIGQGADDQETLRTVFRLFDALEQMGPAALPAIQAFLARNLDLELTAADPGLAKGKGKGPPPGNPRSLLPASLRLGLFEVVRRIGGESAQGILAATLQQTGRGLEVKVLTQHLEALAPGQYRDLALAAARELLAQPPTAASDSPLDRGHRAALFAVLKMYGDASLAAQLQPQLVQADGRVDGAAFNYLRETLGAQALPLVQQMILNPNLVDEKDKEELMKVAAEYVGTDAQANQFWYDAIMNPDLPEKVREKAIKELGGRGFENRDQPTAGDLELAQARLQLLAALQPELQDPKQLVELDKTRARLAEVLDPGLRPPPGAKDKQLRVK